MTFNDQTLVIVAFSLPLLVILASVWPTYRKCKDKKPRDVVHHEPEWEHGEVEPEVPLATMADVGLHSEQSELLNLYVDDIELQLDAIQDSLEKLRETCEELRS